MASLVPLLLQVPPQFESALGYQGRRSLFTIYWDDILGLLALDDADDVFSGKLAAWLAFANHPAVRPVLDGLDFGTAPCHDCFIVDRKQRRFFVTDVRHGTRLVGSSVSEAPSVGHREGTSSFEFAASPTSYSDWVRPATVEEILSVLGVQEREMVRWLDRNAISSKPSRKERGIFY